MRASTEEEPNMSTSRLTKLSAAKYADMADTAEEAQNHVLSIQRRISETEKQLRNLNRETNSEAAKDFEAEIKRQSDRRDLAQAAYLSISTTLTAVRTWLVQLGPNVELQDIPSVFILPNDDENLVEAVERIRAEIDKLTSARANVARAVLPIADLRAETDKHVDALALRGRPTVWADRDQLHVRHNVEGFAAEAIVLLAWLFPDQMKAKLHGEIDRVREDELRRHLPVMPKAERVAKLADLDARILEKERQEEFFICEVLSENTTIPRREHANPAAILGVAIVPVDQVAKILERRAAETKAAGVKVA
jgi:hypothetical protein